MDLLMPALIGGLTSGALYGLLAFSVVVLYKATGVANFAVAQLGTVGAFVVWRLALSSLDTRLAVVAGIAATALLGALVFAILIRPLPSSNPSNVIVRTLALALVLTAVVDHWWAIGQPFAFPQLLPSGRIELGALVVPWATLVTLAVAAALVCLFAYVFNSTGFGLQLKAIAADRHIAQLLGIRYRDIACLVWAVAAVLAAAVALLSANRLLLSTTMLDGALLYSFAGAITFGLTSLPGALIGGLAAGIVNSLVSTYASSEIALLAVFGLLIVTMLARPDGILGSRQVDRV